MLIISISPTSLFSLLPTLQGILTIGAAARGVVMSREKLVKWF